MKPPPFSYHAPSSLDEALSLLSSLDDAKPLAGGQSLIPLLNLRLARPEHLIDLNGISELGRIEHNGTLQIGAGVRQRAAERSEAVRSGWPLVAEALQFVGHPPIRNRGTVGGSVAHADPAAELPTVMTALAAEMVCRSPRGERVLSPEEFFVGFFETALEPDELLVAVRLAKPAPRTGSAFNEVSRRHGDFALVGAAAVVTLSEDGTIADSRVALSGVGQTPVRATGAEERLRGSRPDPDVLQAAADAAREGLEPMADLHGSADYRRHLGGVVAGRALQQACTRAQESR